MTHTNQHTTLVKIAANERDALERVCALNDLHVSFFTIEANEDLILAEIYYTAEGILLYLGRQLEAELELRRTVNPSLFDDMVKITKP